MKLHSEREMLGRNRKESLKPNVKLDMSQRTHHGRQGISGSPAHSWMEWFQANYEKSKFGDSTSYTEASSTYARIWGARKLVCGQNFFLYNFNNCRALVFLGKGCLFLFTYRLWWVFVAVCGLSLVAASRWCSQHQWEGFSLWWFLLWKQALGHTGSEVVARRLSCPGTCGIFSDQGLNQCALHWQAHS